ncbi:MAG: hypothetical protein GY856_40175 [bacterium]|nr:hypothetical protein [bacterium]
MAMKTCDEVTNLLGRWYDGELDERDTRRAAEHVAGCAACSAEIESWQNIDRLLHIEVKAELTDSVLTALRRKKATTGNRGWWLKLAAAAVIAAAVGGLGGRAAGRETRSRMQVQPGQELTSLTLLAQSFAPGSLAGIDTLASELQVGGREEP